MAIERSASPLGRFTLALLCAPLLLALSGCPGDPATTAAAPGQTASNATAPTLQQPGTQKQPSTQQQSSPQATDQQQQNAQAVAAADHAHKVQNLIDSAEASYKSGVNNYNANHLDAARMDFDFAVDTMLSSGMDLKNDPPLADEFERLLSAINSLELVALKQGNGFSPTLEEAPADAASEVTFPPNPELVGKVAAELKTTSSDLPLVINDYVAGWITAFSTRPTLHAHLKASLERAGKYKEMISKILRDNGVPQDLIYQAVTESGFQPQALNRSSGAGGMWQFMPFNDYLQRNGYFDERFDPEESTIAYAKYMKDLYNQFGDWYLAMAAYDWGPARVTRLVARTGYADYWELYRRGGLPAETKAYIPSVIAAIIMAKNPKQYGLTDILPDAPVLSDTVTTSYAIDLRLVADLTGSTVPAIVALNPALLRLSTPSDIPYDLHIPPGTKQTYLDRLKEIPEDDRTSWRFHVVKAGETLDEIAASMHATAAAISSYNDITATQPIDDGDELVIPVEAAASAPAERYKLRRGDTLITVADRFGVSVEQLRAWNHLSSNRAARGRYLYVAEPVRLAPHSSSRTRRGGRSSSRRSRQRSGARTKSSHRAGKPTAKTSTHAKKKRSH